MSNNSVPMNRLSSCSPGGQHLFKMGNREADAQQVHLAFVRARPPFAMNRLIQAGCAQRPADGEPAQWRIGPSCPSFRCDMRCCLRMSRKIFDAHARHSLARASVMRIGCLLRVALKDEFAPDAVLYHAATAECQPQAGADLLRRAIASKVKVIAHSLRLFLDSPIYFAPANGKSRQRPDDVRLFPRGLAQTGRLPAARPGAAAAAHHG